MEKVSHLIIGGGIAGTTAAETIRQRDSSASIAIVSDEPYRLYSRIILSKPNFFLQRIPFDQVWLKTESWYEEKNIRLFAGKTAMALDTRTRAVNFQDGGSISYEKLLLAPGGCVRRWQGVGAEKKGIAYLRTLDDARDIIARVKTAKRAVCVGGGFVSFEMCEMFRMAGLEVSLVMREASYWSPLLDEQSGHIIERALEQGGVKIFRAKEVKEMRGGESVEGVVLNDGTDIPCDLVIVGVGLVCSFGWLTQAGVSLGRGILTNEYLETNSPNIWAAGDAAEFQDIVLGEQIQLGNWVNAQMQGRRAGLNMSGEREPFRLVSFYTTQGFGITVGFVGDVRPLPDRDSIFRSSSDGSSIARLLAKDGELIGATLINRAAELGLISRLIERDVLIDSLRDALGDSSRPLSALLKS